MRSLSTRLLRPTASLILLTQVSCLPRADRPSTVAAVSRSPAALIQERLPGAHVGLYAIDAATGEEIAVENADKRFIPASNLKLFTAAAAMDLLGGDYRFISEVGTVHAGNGVAVVVRCSGDPTIDGFDGACPEDLFARMAAALTLSGFTSVTGLYFDGSFLGGDHYSPAWRVGDLTEPYAAPASAACFDDNSSRIRIECSPGGEVTAQALEGQLPVELLIAPSDHTQILYDRPFPDSPLRLRGWILRGSTEYRVVPLSDPVREAAHRCAAILRQRGVQIAGPVGALEDAPAAVAVAPRARLLTWSSPPLHQIVREMMKRSRNLWADLLLKTLGRETIGEGSFEAGAEAASFYARGIGIPERDLRIVDGSGLASTNLATPRAIVRVLAHMRGSLNGEVYFDSLPLGGVDGTLRNRFIGTPLEGRINAKTGLLSGVSCLSGRIIAHREIIFSLMVNGRVERSLDASAVIDAALVALAQSDHGRSPSTQPITHPSRPSS